MFSNPIVETRSQNMLAQVRLCLTRHVGSSSSCSKPPETAGQISDSPFSDILWTNLFAVERRFY
jgi:hypothetical protein